MKRLFLILVATLSCLINGWSAGINFKDFPLTNNVKSTDLLLIDSALGGTNYVTRTATKATTIGATLSSLSTNTVTGTGPIVLLSAVPAASGANMTNTGPSVVGMVPVYTDTTGTQVTPTNAIDLSSIKVNGQAVLTGQINFSDPGSWNGADYTNSSLLYPVITGLNGILLSGNVGANAPNIPDGVFGAILPGWSVTPTDQSEGGLLVWATGQGPDWANTTPSLGAGIMTIMGNYSEPGGSTNDVGNGQSYVAIMAQREAGLSLHTNESPFGFWIDAIRPAAMYSLSDGYDGAALIQNPVRWGILTDTPGATLDVRHGSQTAYPIQIWRDYASNVVAQVSSNGTLSIPAITLNGADLATQLTNKVDKTNTTAQSIASALSVGARLSITNGVISPGFLPATLGLAGFEVTRDGSNPGEIWANALWSGNALGVLGASFSNNGISLPKLASISFSDTANWYANADTIILRDAANTVAHRNGVNPQQVSIYDTYTDAANFRNGTIGWVKNANALTICTTNLGTAAGTGGSIKLAPLGTTGLTVNTNGTVTLASTISTTGISIGTVAGFTGFTTNGLAGFVTNKLYWAGGVVTNVEVITF